MDNGASSYLRFLNGDKTGFTELVNEYKNGLILFINSFIHDYHISEEAADETFLVLYVKKPHYKDKYSFKTWLYTIGRNTAINYMKKLKIRDIHPISDYYYVVDKTDIEADHIRGEEFMQLHKAIHRLKKEYAQVLYLIFFEGFSNPEAAEIMGRSDQQIADLIYNAKKALKSELRKEDSDEYL